MAGRRTKQSSGHGYSRAGSWDSSLDRQGGTEQLPVWAARKPTGSRARGWGRGLKQAMLV